MVRPTDSCHCNAQRKSMATVLLFILSLLFTFLHPSPAQAITDSSSVLPSPSPKPTKPTTTFWPSLSPKESSDVPMKATIRNRLSTYSTMQKGQRMINLTTQSTATLVPALTINNAVSEPILTQTTASMSRTDTATPPLSRELERSDSPTKGSTLLTSPLKPVVDSLSAVTGNKSLTATNPEEDPVNGMKNSEGNNLGSVGTPPAMPVKEELPATLTTVGNEMSQYRPQAQTATAELMSPKVSDIKMFLTPKTNLSDLTTASRISTAPPDNMRITQTAAQTVQSTGELTPNTPPTVIITSKKDSVTMTSTTTPGSRNKLPRLPVTVHNQTSLAPNVMTQQTTSTTKVLNTTTTQTTSITRNQPNKTTNAGRIAATTTRQSTQPGSSSFHTTDVKTVTQVYHPTYQAGLGQKNRSIPLDHPHQVPYTTLNPPPSNTGIISNVTQLYWGDLSWTLAFAWELHVYGSASLFLLLFAGAALGLTLSPGMNCPHRGALALANGLLFLAGGIRAAFFLIDPYGTRQLLPRPAVIALYNLPLHLLAWTQAALALLALRVAGIRVLPATLERPPLVAILAVLQCTLLLATDLLSSALSPAVPVTLQVLSLCWGLAICLGFLCHVFPRLRCPANPHPEVPEEAGGKTWTGSTKMVVILGRVLAVCALLGALCCGMHVHATLWLHGLLGNWRHFNWGWWLVHFWARLLELAWGFSLLLLGSWVFWRPQACRGREEGDPGDGRVVGDLPSPGQSISSTHRHTCWSKIVQSLRGKPCRKSESNGVGGGGTGEMPNNWAGQERPGADISKSLIRNQNHEQAVTQPRCIKDSNRGRNQRGHSAERGISDGSTGSLMRLQALGRLPQRSVSGSLDHDKDTCLSLCEFDLRPPSPIDLSRSIDAALHREHLLGTGSLFQPFTQPSPFPSPGSDISQGPWLRRNSDPQLLSDSSEAQTESSMPLGGSVLSSVPSRQVTEPPTPSHQGHRWSGHVPSSVSCPVSLHPSRTSTGHLEEEGVDDTRPFITPDSDRVRGRAGRPVGSRSYLEVSRHDDSASVGSEIIDL